MTRLNALLLAVLGLLLGGLAVYVYEPPASLDAKGVRAIVADMLASKDAAAPASQSVAQLDPKTLNPLIENYLMSDPQILDRMNTKLDDVKRTAEREEQKALLSQQHDAIYQDANNVILGNPNGDVTLVEMFDYNCTYCRGALPDLATLLAEDPKLKVILKEFPILTQGSIDAAKVAVLVNDDKHIDYWAFHQALFASRGQVTADTALDEAQKLGMNRMGLQLDMEGKEPAAAVQKSYDLAKALNITGTPTYIIGDELIPGAIGIDQLRARIANMRACGSTACPATDTPAPAG